MIITWRPHMQQFMTIRPWVVWFVQPVPAGAGRIMSSLVKSGGLAAQGGIAGQGGGLAG